MKDIHETAIVDKSVEMGHDCTIGPFAIVESGVVLGDGVTIGAYTKVGRGSRIHALAELKDHVLIGAGAVIGRESSIGSGTEVRGGCVLGARVRLGSKCLLADGTMIGNDSHCSGTFTTCNKPEPGQHHPSVIGPRFYAGVRVTIMPNIQIGEDVVVGASSTVRHNIPSGEVWFGNPARKHR